MTKVNKKYLASLARLAGLELEKGEDDELAPQIDEVFSFFEKITSLRVDDISPTSQTTGLLSVMKEDRIETERILDTREALMNAKSTHNNLFEVPALLDKDKDVS